MNGYELDRELRQQVVRDCAKVGVTARQGKPGYAAVFSDDEVRHRYILFRRWRVGISVHFCMLNPATADESKDDPTVRRCIGFAKRWGYSGLEVTNLFAYCSGDPRDMIQQRDPIGQLNDDFILAAAKRCGRTIVAWGQFGSIKEHKGARERKVLELLRGQSVFHLGLTKDGCPRHPLYLRNDTEPIQWERGIK